MELGSSLLRPMRSPGMPRHQEVDNFVVPTKDQSSRRPLGESNALKSPAPVKKGSILPIVTEVKEDEQEPTGILKTNKKKRKSGRRISFSSRLEDVHEFRKGGAITPKRKSITGSSQDNKPNDSAEFLEFSQKSASEQDGQGPDETESFMDIRTIDEEFLPKERPAVTTSWAKQSKWGTDNQMSNVDRFLDDGFGDNSRLSFSGIAQYDPFESFGGRVRKSDADLEKTNLGTTLAAHSRENGATSREEVAEEQTDDVFKLVTSEAFGANADVTGTAIRELEDAPSDEEDDEISFNLPASSSGDANDITRDMELTSVFSSADTPSHPEKDTQELDMCTAEYLQMPAAGDTAEATICGGRTKNMELTSAVGQILASQQPEDQTDEIFAQLRKAEHGSPGEGAASNESSNTVRPEDTTRLDRTVVLGKTMEFTENHGRIVESATGIADANCDETDDVMRQLQRISLDGAGAGELTMMEETAMDMTTCLGDAIEEVAVLGSDDQTEDVMRLLAGQSAEPEARKEGPAADLPGPVDDDDRTDDVFDYVMEPPSRYSFSGNMDNPFAKRDRLQHSPLGPSQDPAPSEDAGAPAPESISADTAAKEDVPVGLAASLDCLLPSQEQNAFILSQGSSLPVEMQPTMDDQLPSSPRSSKDTTEFDDMGLTMDFDEEPSSAEGKCNPASPLQHVAHAAPEAMMVEQAAAPEVPIVVEEAAVVGAKVSDNEADVAEVEAERSELEEIPADAYEGDETCAEGEDKDMTDFGDSMPMNFTEHDTRLLEQMNLRSAPESELADVTRNDTLTELYSDGNRRESLADKRRVSQGRTPAADRFRQQPKRRQSSVPLPEGCMSVDCFLESIGLQMDTPAEFDHTVMSPAARRASMATPRSAGIRLKRSAKRTGATPRLTPSTIKRLTMHPSENWVSRMLADPIHRDLPIRLVAAYAEAPRLRMLQEATSAAQQMATQLYYALEKLEQDVNTNNPKLFEIARQSPNVRKTIVTKSLHKLQEKCELEAELKWQSFVAEHAAQLGGELKSFRQMLCADITQVNEEVWRVNSSRASVEQAFEASGLAAKASIRSGDRVALKKELARRQELYRISNELQHWRLKSYSGSSILLDYPGLGEIRLHLGDELESGGLAITSSAFSFHSATGEEQSIAMALLRGGDALQAVSKMSSTRAIPGTLAQISLRSQRIHSFFREMTLLRRRAHLPYLVELRSRSDGQVVVKVTFLKKQSDARHFEIQFLVNAHYPFASLPYSIEFTESVSETLRSHVAEIVSAALGGHDGNGFRPITSVCNALVQFLG